MLKTIGLASKCLVSCLALIAAWATTVEARVTRLVIDQRQSPAYDGKSFGRVGQYEILSGRAFGELDRLKLTVFAEDNAIFRGRNDRAFAA